MAPHTMKMGEGKALDDGTGQMREGREGAHIIPFMAGPPARGARSGDPQQNELAGLVARMAAGDEAAFARFYDATVARVYALAFRVCGDAASAEDVTGEVYYQCWNEAGRYDERRSRVASWLLMICRSRAIDALRARDTAILHEDPDTLTAEDDQPLERAPEELLELMQSGTALHSALARLAPLQRQLIALAFFRGLSHQEIATHARLPLGTVKVHIRRALALLRDDLQSEKHG